MRDGGVSRLELHARILGLTAEQLAQLGDEDSPEAEAEHELWGGAASGEGTM